MPLIKPIPDGALRKLQNEGFLLIPLSTADRKVLTATFEAAYPFFHEPLKTKALNKLPEDCGYRPTGIEYSQSSDRPDPIESFTASARTGESGPELLSTSAQVLHSHLLAAIDVLEPIVESLTIQIATEVSGRPHAAKLSGALHRWSCLQLNYSRPAQADRAFINELHEDGHLMTLACATGPGLEVQTNDGRLVPIAPTENEVLAMPGDVTWLLSAGQIRPLYHAVRRWPELSERLALLFFADIEPRLCDPWSENEINANIDIGARVLKNAARFGLRGFTAE